MSMAGRMRARLFRSMALAALGTVFFLWAALCCRELEPFSEQVFGLYQNREHAPAAAEIFERQQNGEPGLSVTWWQKKGRETVRCRETGMAAEAEILALCGRAERLFSEAVSLDYNQIGYCLVGRKTAVSLFGSSDAAGLQVEYGGNRYQVKHVFSAIEEVFVYEAGREENLTFSRLTAACDNREGQAIIKMKVESRFAPDRFLDYAFLAFAAELFLMVLPACAGGRLFSMYRKAAKQKSGWRSLLLSAAGCLLLVVLALFIGSHVHVPPDLLPPKWSDFAFWTELWQEKKAAVRLFFEAELAACDLQFLISFGKTVLCNSCSIVCFVWAGRLRKAG